MPDSEDEQWSRISAESELRPEHEIVADVPEPQITPLPDEPLFDPIELSEVPLPAAERAADTDAESDPEPAPPIQIVPFRAGPVAEPGPDVILAAPFEVRDERAPAAVEEPVEMITDVPVPHPETVEVVADLPDKDAQPQKTPWWRLMLGGGEPRAERPVRAPEAAQPQPRPVPSGGAEDLGD